MRSMSRLIRHVLFPVVLWTVLAIPLAYIAEGIWHIAIGYSYWGTLFALWLCMSAIGMILHYAFWVFFTDILVEETAEDTEKSS